MRIVYRKLKFQTKWASTEPFGLSGGLPLCWSENTTIYQVIKSNFGLDVEFTTPDSGGKCWGVFLYLNPNMQARREQ